ncbi:methyltransferase domain-containing protein [uncultured Tateyamaria sp.]|uniref:class I SAM-dependent methyltransferase n=1 Tax=Tateyamaria sp. 1078 TaxID=3417464 RepID=UPI00260C28A6|nr:methyltransferase domain-containing protein [uncultured Tateyamaria sp.]
MQRLSESKVSTWGMSANETRTAKYEFLLKEAQRRFPPAKYRNTSVARFMDFLCADDGYKYSQHLLRYITTFGAIARVNPEMRGLTILETGGSCPILDFLNGDNECYATESDLRLEIDAPDDFADVLFSFEVIEHIKDRPEKSFDDVVLFRETGIRSFVSEIHRVLKPGGLAFITTPNAASLKVLENLLSHAPPMVFRPHVREYTRPELEAFFAAFEQVAYESMFNFFSVAGDPARRVKIFETLEASTADRGDDHFFCFRKPGLAETETETETEA